MKVVKCRFSCLQYTSGSGSLPQATLTSNICAVCEKDIILEDTEEDGTPVASERTYKLNCGHMYPLHPGSLHVSRSRAYGQVPVKKLVVTY